MPAYLTPGVYRTSAASARDQFVLVRTDVAGFLGFAERGPLPPDDADVDPESVCLKLTSWREYVAHFGGFIPHGYLAYAVRAFFENGGDTCYVLRVAATRAPRPDDRPAVAIAALPIGAPQLAATVSEVHDAWTVSVADTGALRVLDPVEVRSEEGVTTTATVESVSADHRLRLSRRLPPKTTAGAGIWRFEKWGYLTARSAGRWGNRLRVRLEPLEPGWASLRVTVEPDEAFGAGAEEFYARLDFARTESEDGAEAVIARSSALVSLQLKPGGLGPGTMVPAFDGMLGGGRDGLAAVTPADFLGSEDDRRGLRLLQDIEDVAIVCVPEAVFAGAPARRPVPVVAPPCSPAIEPQVDPALEDHTLAPPAFTHEQTAAIYRGVIEHCERLRYRVAVLDVPGGLQPGAAGDWAARQDLRFRSSRFAALYYPWLEVPDEIGVGTTRRRVPACGHVAGAYARRDLQDGVQQPPANAELTFALDVAADVSDDQQGPLNLASLNVIRAFPGRGIRVWGARSLAPDSDAEWRFIHTRRLLSAIERTVEKSTTWVTFEANDHTLRRTLVHSLDVLLEGIWARGGLRGERPEQGYFVKCDETNNPPGVVDAGRLVCAVGVAVAAPMEFVVFELRLDTGGTEVVEG